MTKYTALEQSNEGSSMLARKSHSKERTVRISAVGIERAQMLISDDSGQKVAKISIDVGVSEQTMRRITFDTNRTH